MRVISLLARLQGRSVMFMSKVMIICFLHAVHNFNVPLHLDHSAIVLGELGCVTWDIDRL